MDQRNSDRTSLSQDYRGQVYLAGRTYADVEVTDLGLGGCCLRLPAAAEPHLHDHAVFEDLQLSRPHSGPYFLKARVAWHGRPWFGAGRWIRAGLQFLDTPAACDRELRERVAEGMSHMAP
jgi:c-di-GMP-binding flagellar brake protein YcgR